MEQAAGIIAEYNPFHSGHSYQLQRVREVTGLSRVVCVMSGPFVQRGEAALLSPRARAEMALANGADAVFELPALFAVREAEVFALGGVAMLNRMPGVTRLAFGAETDDLPLLQKAAAVLEEPSPGIRAAIRESLEKGLSYPKAIGLCLGNALGRAPVFGQPNNVLAICYLRALIRLSSPLQPVLIPRIGSYHAKETAPGELPSASCLRAAAARGDWTSARAMTPPGAYQILRNEIARGRFCAPGCLDQALRYCLAGVTPAQLRALPSVSEGLEMRLMRFAPGCADREALLSKLKTKRYPYARLSRLLCHALLGLSQELARETPVPPYARLLGLRREAAPLIAQIKAAGGLPIIEKAARGPREHPCFQLDMRAYDLWAIGAGLALGEGFRQQAVVL